MELLRREEMCHSRLQVAGTCQHPAKVQVKFLFDVTYINVNEVMNRVKILQC